MKFLDIYVHEWRWWGWVLFVAVMLALGALGYWMDGVYHDMRWGE